MLRLGIGVTLTFLIALAYDWTLAYLAPIFAAPLLQGPAAPAPRAAIGIILVTMLMFALFPPLPSEPERTPKPVLPAT